MFISFLLDTQEKLEECLIVLKEFFGERSISKVDVHFFQLITLIGSYCRLNK